MRRSLGAALAGVVGLAAATAFAQASVEIIPVRGNIYLVSGAGSNIVLSAGLDGVFIVDTGLAANSDRVLAAIRELQTNLQKSLPPPPRWGAETRYSTNLEPYYRAAPPKPIRYIANTSALPAHVGGNEKFVLAGKTFTGGNVAGELRDAGEGAAVLAHENVLARLSEAKLPTRALPTDTYFGGVLKLSYFFNGEGVQLFHIPAAVTDGDSIVYFRGSDIVVAGEIFNMAAYPLLDLDRGGSVQGVIAGLNRMLEMAVAEFRSEGGTLFIPAHGRVGDTADLAYYRDMTTMIRDRVQDMIKKGMTLAQVKAAKPTEDWDPRFGQNPSWTPDMFVEAMFKSLTATPKK